MALTIKQLNGDTTFLITCSPPFAPDHPARRKKFPGDYTILLDPWLKGHSSIGHPSFQISHHTIEPEITSLKEIREHIDLIIISQDKPDHCHKETLCSLPKERKIDILATPAAAKKIRSWKYFDDRRVHTIKPYNSTDRDTLVRLPLPAYSSGSAAGEITIANIATKLDVTGLHNAIGITYQPPSTLFTLNTQWERYGPGATVQLSSDGITRPATPARRPRTGSGSPPHPDNKKTLRKSVSYPYLPKAKDEASTPTARSRADSGIAQAPVNHEQVLSVIYTPHGVSPSTISRYLLAHLIPLQALPLTALFHSMNVEQNPWFMGGKVAAGVPGGVELAKLTTARNWVGAHDEVKLNKGAATVFIKSRQYDIEEVKTVLVEAGVSGTRALRLGVGETVRVTGGER